MRKIFSALLFSVLFQISPNCGRTQNFGLGADVMYNFQTESFGAGLRANIFPNRTLSIVPQFSYYPGFNKVHEYYLGLGLELKFLRTQKFDFYAIGHGAYNSWLNYEVSAMEGAQQTNWNLEAGIGVTTRKCLRPFLEYRYNIKFMETHLRLGLLYIFGCNGSSGGKKGGGKNKGLCPAYN